MNQNTSFRISRIPRQQKFIASFKRGWRSQWNHYKQNGTFREFESWDSAWQFLLEKCQGNAAFLATHFCGADPNPADNVEVQVIPEPPAEHQAHGTDTPSLFDFLCDGYSWVKDEMTPEQAFYFLRGILYQWASEHGQDIMDAEDTFIGDIRFIATQGRF